MPPDMTTGFQKIDTRNLNFDSGIDLIEIAEAPILIQEPIRKSSKMLNRNVQKVPSKKYFSSLGVDEGLVGSLKKKLSREIGRKMSKAGSSAFEFTINDVGSVSERPGIREHRNRSPLNDVSLDYQYLYDEILNGLKEMKFRFKENEPMEVTRQTLIDVVKRRFGLKMTTI